MKRKRKLWGIWIPFFVLLMVLGVKFIAQVVCVENTGAFTENFNTVVTKNAALSSVADWPMGPAHLNLLGSNFDVTQPSGMGAQIYVVGSGDFDGDGYPDLIGLDIENNYRLLLVRNHYEDGNNDGEDDDGVIFYIDETEVYDEGMTCGPATLEVADFYPDNKQQLDFFFMKNDVDDCGTPDCFVHQGFKAVMYINDGTETDPDFNPYTDAPNLDFTDMFISAGIYLNWAGDHISATDIDGDGDQDLLIISQDKIFLLRTPARNRFTLNNFSLEELNYDQPTGFTLGRGGIRHRGRGFRSGR